MTVVTKGEEKSLKFCIKYQFCFHQPPIIQTRCEIIWLESCLKSESPNLFNAETGPGDKWHNNFKKRNNLTTRKPINIDHGRSTMANITVYEQHFTLLEKIINDLEPGKEAWR